MKRLLTASLVCTLALTACGQMNDPSAQSEGGNARWNSLSTGNTTDGYNVINRREADHSEYLKYGFVRESKQTAQEKKYPGYAVYDRELLADSISEMAAVIPAVDECGTLVTDDKVFMVYNRDRSQEDMDRNDVADQVRKTALSVVPSYYEVYVCDDMDMMDEIERFGSLYPDTDEYNDTLEQTAEQFKAYPQGEPISRDQMHDDNDDYMN
ncbi:YhcN/YlaJ family sporulation lipoprotein [Alteribacter aurantiacus]|uniref:YhcN/YlaJ family sporulation lipoprotein n=1 Tax=Alteribacter aurantiacus TaxID=254410 RepID=UPI00040D0639|nr:YhcN/YlaJ family sporulation lipoprotein [Alteribacter aurantiacus]